MFGQLKIRNKQKIPKNEKTTPDNGDKAKLAQIEAKMKENIGLTNALANNQDRTGRSLLSEENLLTVARVSGSTVKPLEVDSGNKVYINGIWFTPEQAAELSKTEQEIAEKKRFEAESANTESGKPSLLERFKNKFFGQKQVEEIKQETVEKSPINPYQIPDNILTIASINKTKSVIQNNLTDLLTRRINAATGDKQSKLFEKLKQKIPELSRNPDFRNFLAHNLHTLQKAYDQPGPDGKVQLMDISNMKFGDIVRKLQTYKGLEKVGQSDLIARFFVGQIVSLGRVAIRYSEYLENDHYMALDPKREAGKIGTPTKYIKTELWDHGEKAVQKNIQQKALLGKYSEGGYDQSLFQIIKEIVGDDVYQETIDQVFPLGLMQNLKYNEEEKQVNTVKLDPEFMGLIENILTPKAKEAQNIPPLPDNVLQFNQRSSPNQKLGQPTSNVVQLRDRNERKTA